MANVKITALANYTTQHGDDLIPIVDIHDSSMYSSGTDKGCTVHNLFGAASDGQIIAWSGSSTGTPVGRALIAADLPVFVASGGSHAKGAVPDPGGSSGTTKYLREDATWQVPSGSGTGTVESVTFTGDGTVLDSNASSPVTTTGTLTASLLNQSANKVLAGPTTTGSALPTFRSIVAADLPVFIASGTSHAVGAVPDPGATAGTSKFLCENATWGIPAGTYTPPGSGPGSGTVTSIGFEGDGTVLSSTVSGPITSSGTLVGSLNTQTANYVFAGPTTGTATAPTFRPLVTADMPAGYTGGTVNRIFSQVTQVTVASAGTATLLSTTSAIGSLVIAANSLIAGNVLRFQFGGWYSSTSSPGTWPIGILFGSTVIATTQTLSPIASQTNAPWNGTILLACTHGGGAGSSVIWSSGEIRFYSATTTSPAILGVGPAVSLGTQQANTGVSPNLTIDNTVDVKVLVSVSSQQLSLTHLTIEKIG